MQTVLPACAHVNSSLMPNIEFTTIRMKFRREANQADNRAATVSVDSLINYEAVKVGALRSYTSLIVTNADIEASM